MRASILSVLVLLVSVIKGFGSFSKNQLRQLDGDGEGEERTELIHGQSNALDNQNHLVRDVVCPVVLPAHQFSIFEAPLYLVGRLACHTRIFNSDLHIGWHLSHGNSWPQEGYSSAHYHLTTHSGHHRSAAQNGRTAPIKFYSGSIGQVLVKVQISGWVAQVLGFAGCLIGMFLIHAGTALTIGLVVLSLFWGGGIIFMEIGYRKNLGYKPPKASAKIRDSYDLKAIRDPSKTLGVIDNKVINLKNFAKYHPGGYFLIQKNFGTDMSRYFYGVYGHNQHFKAHTHALYNWNWMEKRVVGIVTENYDLQELMFTSAPESEKWSILEQQPITTLITRVSFGSKGIVSRPIMICDPTTWGKHFKYEVTTPFGKRTRFYTFSFALGKQSLAMHQAMAKAYNAREEYESNLNASDKVETIDAFPKLYNYPKAVSRFLITTDVSNSYNEMKLSAPMGVGLGIVKGDNGSYVAITAGTGIVPMMDLVCYLFRKNVTQAAARNNLKIQGFKDEVFDLLGDNFKLELWASFVKRDEVVGLEILQTLAEISEKEGFNTFILKLRISGEGAPRWDSNFVQMNFNPNVDGVFIRGPQEFNWKMEDNLVRIGYDVQKILHI